MHFGFWFGHFQFCDNTLIKMGNNNTFLTNDRNPNPDSNFDQRQLTHISPEHASGTIVFNIVSIGDDKSIPGFGNPNANGYIIEIGADDPLISVTVDSITRISVSTN